MQHFYDGQIRRYLTQTIRVFSNFTVKYGDGTLVRVPVMYGDPDRQVANIIKQNSENKVNSVPRIAVYISGLDIDRDRTSDATYVGKLHVREREIVNGVYTQNQGKNYTIERLMPTPFKLTMKVDIWSANTEQKLQILEQILVLFNPSLELQTSDNYVDWTSLTVLNMSAINWSSRQVPAGVDSAIDVASLTVDTPIWLSPPVKVKHLGVITKIVTSLYNNADTSPLGYIDGLGNDPADSGTTSFANLLDRTSVTITDYQIQVRNLPSGVGQVILLGANESVVPMELTLDIPTRQGTAILWDSLFAAYPASYVAGSSMLYLTQPNGTNVVGTIAVDPLDPTILTVNWDSNTLIRNYSINSVGAILEFDVNTYNAGPNNRPNSPGTFDAIINPQVKGPRGSGLPNPTVGMRYLIIEDIGAEINADGADAWKSNSGEDFIAKANDIIEWDGNQWNVIFAADQFSDIMIWQTNIYTGVQYTWNGVSWVKSFEGEYGKGQWKIVL